MPTQLQSQEAIPDASNDVSGSEPNTETKKKGKNAVKKSKKAKALKSTSVPAAAAATTTIATTPTTITKESEATTKKKKKKKEPGVDLETQLETQIGEGQEETNKTKPKNPKKKKKNNANKRVSATDESIETIRLEDAVKISATNRGRIKRAASGSTSGGSNQSFRVHYDGSVSPTSSVEGSKEMHCSKEMQKDIEGYVRSVLLKVSKIPSPKGYSSMVEVQSQFSVCMNHAQKVGENKAAAKLIISMLEKKGVPTWEVAPSDRDKAFAFKGRCELPCKSHTLPAAS